MTQELVIDFGGWVAQGTTTVAIRDGLLRLPVEVMEEEWFSSLIRPPVVFALLAICGVNILVSIQALLSCSGIQSSAYPRGKESYAMLTSCGCFQGSSWM